MNKVRSCLFALLVASAALGEADRSVDATSLDEPLVYRFKLNSNLGLFGVDRTAILTGAQFGFAWEDKSRFFVGPEMQFALFSPGSLFNLLISGWYDIPLSRRSGTGLALGLATGVGYAVPPRGALKPVNFVIFGDVSISREIDELVSLRLQARPGFVQSRFAYMINLSVSFRFV